MPDKSNRRDGAATIDEAGNVSNGRLHEQMTEGVDDYGFQMQTRAKLFALGVPASALDSVLPVRPEAALTPEYHFGQGSDHLPTVAGMDFEHSASASSRECRSREFNERVIGEFLPSFCEHYKYDIRGFVSKTLDRVGDYDAMWFLKALEAKVVVPDGAFFSALRSGAKEQIFWQYGKSVSMRQLSLWAEPVITIGAAGRLHCEFGWPKDRIGLQSQKSWAFDLVAYNDPGTSRADVVCEVKKSKNEIDYLVGAMLKYLSEPPLTEEPAAPKKRNAYSKVVALRESQPRLVWILGPENYGKLFRFVTDSRNQKLEEIDECELRWQAVP